VGTRTRGVGVGTARARDREDHVKGQACLGCKRNVLRLEGQHAPPELSSLTSIQAPTPTTPIGMPTRQATTSNEEGSHGYLFS